MDVEGHFGFEMQAYTIEQLAFLLGTPHTRTTMNLFTSASQRDRTRPSYSAAIASRVFNFQFFLHVHRALRLMVRGGESVGGGDVTDSAVVFGCRGLAQRR